MIKTIRTDQLRLGMFVNSLHRKWYQHSFLFNRFLLDNPKTLQKLIQSGIKEVEIDTGRGLDIAAVPAGATAPSSAYPLLKTATAGSQTLHAAASLSGKTAIPMAVENSFHYPIPLQKEIQTARKVLGETQRVIEDVMSEVRSGAPLNDQKVQQAVGTITDSILQTPDALIGLSRIKNWDRYTYQHSVGVCALLIAFCKEYGMDDLTLRKVGMGGLLHDVGKMQLPAGLLNKKEKLTNEEYKLIQKHVEYGRRILERTPAIPKIAVQVALQHHERCDGSGYPNHVESAEISWYGQMAAIADMYDAAISPRPYRPPLEPTEALRQIYEMRTTFLNPELVEQFIKFLGVYPVGSLVSLSNGAIGFVIRSNRENRMLPTVRIIYDGRSERPVPKYDLDLSHPTPRGTRLQITGIESVDKYGFDPMAVFLNDLHAGENLPSL